MRSIVLFIASLATAFVQAAAAQDVPARVGRLAYTQGSVSVYQDPELGWDRAYVNTPITSENSVWTERGARAEMRVGGIAARLDGETQLDVARLEENDFDATVQRGSVNVRLRYKERNDRVTFSTPHALFMLETDGRYRLDVDEDRDESRLTVFGGYAYMESAGGRIGVEPGRTVVVGGGSGQYVFERAREGAFDKWATVRDQQWQDSNSRRYVSSDMTGYEELDRYGTWSQDADYGPVWYPTRVESGWAPYRDGHWTYVRPWGWTWVDDQPWGYAPSHYGRWVQVRDRWGWTPGRVREAPIWAPALVGFIGGAGFSIGISGGSSPVGWYPLAPWERYEPWYRTNTSYVTRVNRVVIDRQPRWYTGRGDDWRRWNRDRAATVVNRDVFVNRRPVQGAIVRMNPETIRQASVVSAAQMQQALPQRNELLRFRETNRVNVAAPTVMRERRQEQAQPGAAPVPQQQQQAQGQVVRPDFRRRGAPPVVAPAPAGQAPQMAAPAPLPPSQRREPATQPGGPSNPMARPDNRGAPQLDRAAIEAQQRNERLQAETQQKREQAAREAAQSTRELQERAARGAQQQQQDQQRQAREAQQQQERAAREAQQQQQRASEQQRQQQNDAQRAAREQQDRAQREAQGRDAQAREAQQREAQQRQAREAQQQQEQAQRDAQQQQQRAAQQLKQQQEQAQREAQQQQQRGAQQLKQQQEAQQRAAQQQAQQAQQAQERAAREAQQQRAAPPAPAPQQAAPQQAAPAPQANPAARGDGGPRGRNRDKDKEDKDKEEKEKKDKR